MTMMIERLDPAGDASALNAHYRRFLDDLEHTGFRGEIAPELADRSVLATDNSIYQRLPQALLYPRDAEDLERIARLIARDEHRSIVLAPRGGGTGPTASR
nr:hypothetical protein [Salinicola tamaricis]